MTEKEIDFLLSMLNEKSVDEVKQYLIKLKEFAQNELRQKKFEEYLTNNRFGVDPNTMPKLYFSDKEQIFTNHVSLYMINSCFFKTDTEKLSSKENHLRTFAHKYKLDTKDNFERMLGKIYSKCKNYVFQNVELWISGNYVTTEHVDNGKIYENTFDLIEILYADIFLNYPIYKISPNIPLLYAENDIGKAYILGRKKD